MNGTIGKIIAAILGVLTSGVFLFSTLMLQRMEFHERTLERYDDRLRHLEAVSAQMITLRDDISIIRRDLDYLRRKIEARAGVAEEGRK